MLNAPLLPERGRFAVVRSCRMFAACGLLAISLIAAPSWAADLPVTPVYKAPPMATPSSSWTGFYIGVGFGSRSSVADPTMTDLATSVGTTFRGFCDSEKPDGGCVTSEPLNDTAFRVSPYVGFNWQFAPSWIVGLEGDVGFANKKTTLDGVMYPLTVSILGPADGSFALKTTWDASARLRLGVLANPSLLFYVTGGPA